MQDIKHLQPTKSGFMTLMAIKKKTKTPLFPWFLSMVFRSFPGYMRSPAGSSPWSWCSPMHHGETWRLKKGLDFYGIFCLNDLYIYIYYGGTWYGSPFGITFQAPSFGPPPAMFCHTIFQLCSLRKLAWKLSRRHGFCS